MKRRRTLIMALLLVTTLALGIGYAELSTDLTVNGSVSNTPHPINVTFTGGELSATEGTAEAKEASSVVCTNGAQTATLNAAGLVHKDDFVVATFTVKNNNLYSVELSAPAVNETKDPSAFFTATTTWLDGSGNEIATNPILAGGESATFKVTVKMDKNTAEVCSGDFIITVTATSNE